MSNLDIKKKEAFAQSCYTALHDIFTQPLKKYFLRGYLQSKKLAVKNFKWILYSFSVFSYLFYYCILWFRLIKNEIIKMLQKCIKLYKLSLIILNIYAKRENCCFLFVINRIKLCRIQNWCEHGIWISKSYIYTLNVGMWIHSFHLDFIFYLFDR